MLPPGCTERDGEFDMPSGEVDYERKTLRPRKRIEIVPCPKCNGNYAADPFHLCSNCLKGRVTIDVPDKKEDVA